MAKKKEKRKKSTKWETTIYKTIHVKLKMELHNRVRVKTKTRGELECSWSVNHVKIELHNRVRVKTPLKPGVNSGAPEA